MIHSGADRSKGQGREKMWPDHHFTRCQTKGEKVKVWHPESSVFHRETWQVTSLFSFHICRVWMSEVSLWHVMICESLVSKRGRATSDVMWFFQRFLTFFGVFLPLFPCLLSPSWDCIPSAKNKRGGSREGRNEWMSVTNFATSRRI